MNPFQEAMQAFGRGLVAGELGNLQEAVQQRDDSLSLLEERLAELELSLEDSGWQRLSGESDREFSREGLRVINKMARIYWLKNPLIKRGVLTQTQYVFGRGVNIAARHPLVNEVIQKFLDDPKNKAELTSHQARGIKEMELQLFSNLFFTFFVNKSTGRVRVRSINPDEIDEVIKNPEDAKEPWYYKRVWTRKRFDMGTGLSTTESVTTYYPDWRYTPAGGHPATIGGHQVEGEVPVYHVAVNKLSDMTFGVSEVYAAMDWAKAYKNFLGDWATIVRSYARFAWQLTAKGGQKGVAATATKLSKAVGVEQPITPNPVTGKPPQAGAVMVTQQEGAKLEPIKTAGATTKAEDGRRLLLMVSAGMGIFEHYFGDPSTGNLATAKSMERPMELMFLDRQALWADVFQEMFQFVIDQDAKAPSGKLPGREVLDEVGERVVQLDLDSENEDPELAKQPIDRHVTVEFPSILEKDVVSRIDALIKAATLDGKTLAGTIDLMTITRLLLVALEVDNVDEVLEQLFPDGKPPEQAQEDPEAPSDATPAESKVDRILDGALGEFREAIARLADEPTS